MMVIESPYDINETLGRLMKILVENEMTIFAIIDHSGQAAQVGINMPYTKVIIFGNPKTGTNFMLKDPNFALNLPLKIMIRENKGKTELVHQKVEELASEYQLIDQMDSLKKMDNGIEAIISQVIKKK